LSLKSKDVISIRDFTKQEIEYILDKARDMENILDNRTTVSWMKGKFLANLFFEPSIRTKLSFASAMQRLGGAVIEFEDVNSTLTKNETLIDTIKVVEKYSDIIVIRHPKEGAARLASEISSKPVINAGDGGNQHPTQTLLDLYTIKKLKGRIDGLDIALVGDLKYGRVMKPLAYALAMFNANLTLVSPIGFEMPKEIISELIEKFEANIIQTDSVMSGVKNADVIYVCGIQKEKFEDIYEAERIERSFRITPEAIKRAKEDVILLHALPKTSEIDLKVDEMPVAKYYQQAYYGVPVRMAILSEVSK